MKQSEIKNLAAISKDMVAAGKDRNSLWDAVDDCYHAQWEPPGALRDKEAVDFRRVVNMKPHDALNAATKAFSIYLPKFKVQPMSATIGERDRCEKISEALKWHFNLMCQRGPGNFLWDVVHSAMRYDMICCFLDYIPAREQGGMLSHSRRRGVFAPKLYHPKYIYHTSTVHGLNRILLTTTHTVPEVIARYSGVKDANVDKLRLKQDESKGEVLNFKLNDMTWFDDEIGKFHQTVWGDFSDTGDIGAADGKIIILDTEIGTPFIPWIIRAGGSSLESDDQFKVHPLLAPVIWSGAWDTLNIAESLFASEGLRYARMPRIKSIRNNPESGIDIDYENGSTVTLGIGEDVQNIQPPQIDPQLYQIVNKFNADISAATIASIIYDLPQLAPNAPFASISAFLQNAVSSLTPQRRLAESFLEDLAYLMLEYTTHYKEPLFAYRTTTSGKEAVMQAGAQISLENGIDYDLESIFVSVELTPDTPTDEMQRVNMAMLKNQMKIPITALHAELGYANSEVLTEEWMQEKVTDAIFGNFLKLQQAQAEIVIQQMIAAGQQPPQGAGGQFPANAPVPAFDNMRGQGYNANMGGTQTAQGAPSMTREMIP